MLQALRPARTGTSYWARNAIYADRSIIVLNKPAGLICQASDPSSENNKPRNFDKFNELLRDVKRSFNLESLPYPVHRLDKPTTGTLLLARNAPAARQLSQQFQSRVVGKIYLALVRGGDKSFPARSGEIRDPLEFNDGRVSVGESCAAKFAATDWELLASSPTAPLSLLKLTLHTGLKHQLRIHLAHSLHTPVLGDNLYAKSNISDKITKITQLPENRVFLHAAQLTLSRYRKTGPSKRFRLGIGAPLPKDFLAICADAQIPLDRAYVDGGLFVDGQHVDDVPDLEGRWLRKSPHNRSRDESTLYPARSQTENYELERRLWPHET